MSRSNYEFTQRNQNYSSDISWVFFALGAKPTSMRKALAERLAEKESVVIVEQPVSLLRDRKAPGLESRYRRIAGLEACWLYRPLHYPERFPLLGQFLKLVNRRRLQRELDQLLPRGTKRVICYDSPTQDHFVEKLGEDISIYLAVDDKTLTVWGEPIRGELEAEKRLLSKVDKVVCVSEILAEVLMSRMTTNRKIPVRILPNGYDERIFDPNKNYSEPNFLSNIPRPRILITGHVSERIDWDGIAGAARLRPQWTWIFVGPVDKGMKERIQNEFGEHGIYHPPIPVGDVPAWIGHCDACAVPYRLNPFTTASHPLKAIECLAMGAPTLSTKIRSLQCYDGVIEWVTEADGQSYARALALFENQETNETLRIARRKAVGKDSWAIRVDQFRTIALN